jgi:uncharacterized alpha-E superfamily protein
MAGVDLNALKQNDPVGYNELRWELNDLGGQVKANEEMIKQHKAAKALKESEAQALALQQASEVLAREIKGWSPNLAKELRSVAKSLGAEDRDIDGINAPWIVRALHAQKLLSEMTAKAAKAPAPAPAAPVQTITGARDVARKDPDKMSIDEWMAAERRRAAKLGRRF